MVDVIVSIEAVALRKTNLKSLQKLDMIEKMNGLLKRKSSCVLATTNGDRPHCSLMAYITLEAADRLYLVTPIDTKKYHNIKKHPDVSLLIDTRGEQVCAYTQALTISGTCYILESDEEIDSVKEAFERQHPHLQDFIRNGGVAFLCVEFDAFLFAEGPERTHHEIISNHGGNAMKDEKDIFDIFEKDESYRFIMKRLLEASMEESYNSILISEAGPGYPIVYANPAFTLMTGYEPEEVIGKSPSILQGPKTDQEVIDRLKMDISHGRVFHGRAINYRKDGSEFMMQWKIAPIQNEKNETTHYLAIQQAFFEWASEKERNS